MRHCVLRLVLVGVLALLVSGAASADVLRNKTTGETITGTLTDGEINGKRIVKLPSGGSRFIDLSEWEVTRAVTAPADPSDDQADDSSDDSEAPDRVKRVYMIPIKGGIMYSSLLSGMELELEKARKWKADVVVLHMDTPGGRVDLAYKIIGMLDDVDWAKTVAWVEGNENNGAISAGAYVSLSTHEIYMASGTVLGGAVPYSIHTGSAEVDAKMQSIFRARFRSLAQKRGHPAALADAMVDSSVSVIQVFLDGKQQLVDEDEARRLQSEHATDGTFRRGKTVCKVGKVLTLTAKEATEYGICRAMAADFDELMQKMELPKYLLKSADDLPEYVKREAEKKKREFETYRSMFNTNIRQAGENDPRRFYYNLDPETNKFLDGGRRWQANSDRCLLYLKKCAEALKGIEKLSGEERSDYNFPDEMFNDWKTTLQTMFDRVRRERDLKYQP